MPELGIARENIVFISGIGCSSPLPVLHEHLRHALDPRPRAGDRHRPVDLAARPVGLGGHRRRRRAVDRRQPPDPRAAPQRQPEDPAVQQPDLRADQGPVLPHVGAGQDHQVDADGLARQPVQPGVAGARRRGDLRGPHAGLRPQAPARRCCAPRPSTRAPRWSRSTRTATSSTTARSTCSRTATTRDDWIDPPRARPAAALRRRRLARRWCATARRRAARSRRTSPRTTRGSSCTTRTPRTRPTRSRCRGCQPVTVRYAPMGVFRSVERPTYDRLMAAQLTAASAAAAGRRSARRTATRR